MHRRRTAAIAAGILCAALACGGEPAGEAWPPGSVVVGEARPVVAILEGLQGWRGTPLARQASLLAERLEGCEGFVAEAPEGVLAPLIEAVRCGVPSGAAADELPQGLRRLREEGDVAFLLRPQPGVRIAGRMRAEPDGSLAVEARLGGPEPTGMAALAWAAERPPGPPRLGGQGSLIHARLRPRGGLDLASLVPEGGQGDRLFRLKSELFAGTVLAGVWEMAVYLPPEGSMMPLAALGIDVASRRLAVAAMERFVDDVTSTWPVERVPFAAGGHEGACLPRLNLMPELAPCYVATPDQLVVGWNQASVEHALRAGGEPGLGEDGGLLLHLDRFDEADRRLRRAHAPDTPPARIDYTWKRLLARAEPDGDGLRLEIRMPAGSRPAGAASAGRTHNAAQPDSAAPEGS